uniref:Family with sequence similarity 151 member B n=1 Tax=Latimeria chalumnae TaxID=7897 RepID=H3AIT8_LATCH
QGCCEVNAESFYQFCLVLKCFASWSFFFFFFEFIQTWCFSGNSSESVVDFFFRNGLISVRDGAEIIWYHAANSKAKLKEALQSSAHMIEADVLLRGQGSPHEEPIMAHPPDTDSDITLREWLNEVLKTDMGIKLDFKSLAAVEPSMKLLQVVKTELRRPVWINADILPGPNGRSTTVEAQKFLGTVRSFFPAVTLSLGWTTSWHPEADNEGYSWEMVNKMEDLCKHLCQMVTFPVRAALVCQSWPQLLWLLQQSDRYSLTVWTGKDDQYSVEDLLYIRDNFDKTRIYYDISEPQDTEFRRAIGFVFKPLVQS